MIYNKVMRKYAIRLIISGGQTGVDRAGLDFALAHQIPCSGWCPLGRKAEDGHIDARYPLKQTSSELYPHRTRLNVKDSDATLIITDGSKSRGTGLTQKCANQYYKPLFIAQNDTKETIVNLNRWLEQYKPRILNIAGPRGSECSEIYQLAIKILQKSLKKSKEPAPEWPPIRPDTTDLFKLIND